MPLASSIFLILSLVLAVTIGPQTHPWTWGPALFAMAFAVASAIPVIWKRDKGHIDGFTMGLGALTMGWFALRAFFSPVEGFGRDDLLLLAGVVGSFISIRAIMGNRRAEQMLSWGIALLLLASLVVIALQLSNPTYRPIFKDSENAIGVTGFFNHYNYGANFLIASSLLVLGMALYGPHSKVTKIVFTLIGIAGVVSVYLTNSRGGLLSVIIGAGVFVMMLLIIGHRRKAPWFAIAAIGFPLLALAAGIGLFIGWQHIQEGRGDTNGVSGVFDNNVRLYYLGIALSCIGLHPFIGGGSRSFSWESFRFADIDAHGSILSKNPDMVHNEWVQALTEYGIIGAALLSLFIGAIVISALNRTLFDGRSKSMDTSDAWRLGAMAALAGILVHSCFSFVFHLIPGAILLGICLALLTRNTKSSSSKAHKMTAKSIASVAGVLCVVTLIPMGWKGTKATHVIWDAYLGKESTDSTFEEKAKLYQAAVRIWPDYLLYESLGRNWHELATEDPENYEAHAEHAIAAYQKSFDQNPYRPYSPLNQAQIYSYFREDKQAAELFEQAIEVQYGMEPAFRAHYHYSIHLMRKGLRHLRKDELKDALTTLNTAARQVDLSIEKMPWIVWQEKDKLTAIHINCGLAREANGDIEGALKQYNMVSTKPYGRTAHYHAGRALEKRGMATWQKREPEKAYTDFTQAHLRLRQAGNTLPPNVTPEDRKKDLLRLENIMRLMKDAGIVPE